MKFFNRIFSLLLALVLIFSALGCAKLEEFFGNSGDDTDGASNLPEIDPRVPGVYNFLLVRESENRGDADSFFVAQISLSQTKLSIFQIPENLYINTDDAKSLGDVYKKNYDKSHALGLGDDECAIAALTEIGKIFASEFALPIDYHIAVSREAMISYIDMIEGVTVDLPFAFTTDAGNTYNKGEAVLDGEAAYDFVNYEYFRDSGSRFNAAKAVLAGIHEKLISTLTSETISIHMILGKPFFANDIPAEDGYDIFFLRKLIAVTPENWSATKLCTSPVSVENGDYEVLHRSSVLSQLNSFLSVYNYEITEEMFDPQKKFTDTENMILNAMYKSNKTLPTIYSADDIYKGNLEIYLE